jgi:hypothetical protein
LSLETDCPLLSDVLTRGVPDSNGAVFCWRLVLMVRSAAGLWRLLLVCRSWFFAIRCAVFAIRGRPPAAQFLFSGQPVVEVGAVLPATREIQLVGALRKTIAIDHRRGRVAEILWGSVVILLRGFCHTCKGRNSRAIFLR